MLGDLWNGEKMIDDVEFVRTIAVARITMPRSMVRLSAGRESMSEPTQALCFLAGANSIFTGDKLLTIPNAGDDADAAMFAKLGPTDRGIPPRKFDRCVSCQLRGTCIASGGDVFLPRPTQSMAPRLAKLAGRLDRPIVLVGLMGAGKSTVGRILAKRLGLRFVDTDVALADQKGLSPAEMFERDGEVDFRENERQLIAKLMDGQVRVIATGGGAFVDPDTRALLNRQAVTVWLDAPVGVLAERTSRLDTRPLLRNADPNGTIKRLAEERRPSYASAQIRVESRAAPDQVAALIVNRLAVHLASDKTR